MVDFSAYGRPVAPAPFVYNTALPLRNCFRTFVGAQLVYLSSGLPVGVRVRAVPPHTAAQRVSTEVERVFPFHSSQPTMLKHSPSFAFSCNFQNKLVHIYQIILLKYGYKHSSGRIARVEIEATPHAGEDVKELDLLHCQ